MDRGQGEAQAREIDAQAATIDWKGTGKTRTADLEMQQTAADGFSLTDGARSSQQGGAFSLRVLFGIKPEKTTSQVRAPGVRELADEPVTVRGGRIERRTAQANRSRRILFFWPEERGFGYSFLSFSSAVF